MIYSEYNMHKYIENHIYIFDYILFLVLKRFIIISFILKMSLKNCWSIFFCSTKYCLIYSLEIFKNRISKVFLAEGCMIIYVLSLNIKKVILLFTLLKLLLKSLLCSFSVVSWLGNWSCTKENCALELVIKAKCIQQYFYLCNYCCSATQ